MSTPCCKPAPIQLNINSQRKVMLMLIYIDYIFDVTLFLQSINQSAILQITLDFHNFIHNTEQCNLLEFLAILSIRKHLGNFRDTIFIITIFEIFNSYLSSRYDFSIVKVRNVMLKFSHHFSKFHNPEINNAMHFKFFQLYYGESPISNTGSQLPVVQNFVNFLILLFLQW